MPSPLLFILFQLVFGINHPHFCVKKKSVGAEKGDKYEAACPFAQIM